MSPRKTIAAGLMLACWAAAAVAQVPREALQRPLLSQAVRGRWIQVVLQSGRIRISATQMINHSMRSGRGSERLNMRPDSIDYESNIGDDRFLLESKANDYLRLQWFRKVDSVATRLELLQGVNTEITLSVGPKGSEKVFRGPTLWHLLLSEDDACRQDLVTLLETLRPDWRLAERATAVEEELLRQAAAARLPDRQRWAELVKQLADDRFAKREAADRELRSAGPSAAAYLSQLDFARLEAEQQVRISRILTAQSQESEDDSSDRVAAGLAMDPTIWLALLSRPLEPTRTLAAAQLGRILGQPLEFSASADEKVRREQIEKLRTKITPKR